MKKEITLFVTILLVLTPFVMAQETQFRAGITPNIPILYGLDRAFERIRMAFTFGNENKVNYGLKIAEERIGEIESMIKKENQNGLDRAINEKDEIMEGIEIDSEGVSEQIKLQIRTRLETHNQEMVRIKNEHTQKEGVLFQNFRNEIDKEIQNTNSLRTRIRGT